MYSTYQILFSYTDPASDILASNSKPTKQTQLRLVDTETLESRKDTYSPNKG